MEFSISRGPSIEDTLRAGGPVTQPQYKKLKITQNKLMLKCHKYWHISFAFWILSIAILYLGIQYSSIDWGWNSESFKTGGLLTFLFLLLQISSILFINGVSQPWIIFDKITRKYWEHQPQHLYFKFFRSSKSNIFDFDNICSIKVQTEEATQLKKEYYNTSDDDDNDNYRKVAVKFINNKILLVLRNGSEHTVYYNDKADEVLSFAEKMSKFISKELIL